MVDIEQRVLARLEREKQENILDMIFKNNEIKKERAKRAEARLLEEIASLDKNKVISIKETLYHPTGYIYRLSSGASIITCGEYVPGPNGAIGIVYSPGTNVETELLARHAESKGYSYFSTPLFFGKIMRHDCPIFYERREEQYDGMRSVLRTIILFERRALERSIQR
jgi:hypothetical protein